MGMGSGVKKEGRKGRRVEEKEQAGMAGVSPRLGWIYAAGAWNNISMPINLSLMPFHHHVLSPSFPSLPQCSPAGKPLSIKPVQHSFSHTAHLSLSPCLPSSIPCMCFGSLSSPSHSLLLCSACLQCPSRLSRLLFFSVLFTVLSH